MGNLVSRVRAILAELPRVEEQPMAGGTAFMVNGRLCIGAARGRLVCRLEPGKRLVSIDEKEVRSARKLRYWVDACLESNWKARSYA